MPRQRLTNRIVIFLIFLVCTVISYFVAVLMGAKPVLSAAFPTLFALLGILAQIPYVQKELSDALKKLEKILDWALDKIRDFLKKPEKLRVMLMVMTIVLIIAISWPGIAPLFSHLEGLLRPVPTATIGPPSKQANQFHDISDGRFAFDTLRASGQLKSDAAQSLQAGHTDAARSDWQLALEDDPTDAEALIYQEDQSILPYDISHFTLVVAVSLTPDPNNSMLHSAILGAAHDTLQGVYVEQKKYNEIQGQLHHPLAVVLIANISSSQTGTSASQVAQEIIRAQQAYGEIAGMIGWPPGSDQAVQMLSQAHIPMVSPAPLSDALLKLNMPYLFSVAPSLATEAQVGVQYSIQTWNPDQFLLIEDSSDPYSSALAGDVSSAFSAMNMNSNFASIYFTTGFPGPLCGQIEQYLGPPNLAPPTIIYFAGYPDDVASVLTCTRSYPTVHVIGGDVLYQRIHSILPPTNKAHAFDGLVFTAFAYPDTIKPGFVSDYKKIYGTGRPPDCIYDCIRPDNDVILGSDAALALLSACQQVGCGNGQQLSQAQAVQQALTQFSPAHPQPGASRQIAFARDGTLLDKTVLVLWIDNGNTKQQAAIEGQ